MQFAKMYTPLPFIEDQWGYNTPTPGILLKNEWNIYFLHCGPSLEKGYVRREWNTRLNL